MNLIISFSSRDNGNCYEISKYISNKNDKNLKFKDLNIHNCSSCSYECFDTMCKYRNDDIYGLINSMFEYEKVYLIVPMYCNNPSSLYFIFNERCQDYFMHNEEKYNLLINKLYFIGIYGSKKESPDFLNVFNKWFDESLINNHVLGIERHLYNLKLNDSVISVDKVKEQLNEFM